MRTSTPRASGMSEIFGCGMSVRWALPGFPGKTATAFMRFSLCHYVRKLLGLRDRPGGVDQADVAECLREVAQQLSGSRVDLLGQQADIVAVGDRAFEDLHRLVDLPGQGEGVGQPE